MTYNQLITTLTNLLSSHAMIKEVKNATPREWLFRDNNPEFPVCCFSINSGSMNVGKEQIYNVQFFFLDKSGAEMEFEQDVISDQWQISEDIIQMIRSTKRDYYIDDNITINAISDKYEDYLAGVEFTANIYNQRDFDACDAPII
jgi:hypothetical protein